MLLAIAAIVIGLLVLVLSADRFVEAAAALAHHFGVSTLLIGMVILGFGTSAPELTVSVISAVEGRPALALGNAFGSNIANIALILGVVALLKPVPVHSQVIRRELPILAVVTVLVLWQIYDGILSQWDAAGLLIVFAGVMLWSVVRGRGNHADTLTEEVNQQLARLDRSPKWAAAWLVLGLLLLIGSSRLLVWGAVTIAQLFGVSDLIIGLTVVAIGTSLPELAASIAATRKGENDIAVGNVVGSNLFNTLAVIGLAGVIEPIEVPPEALSRDWPFMVGLTLAVFVFGYGKGREGVINRWEGALLLASFVGYTGFLIIQQQGA
ncbi:MAG: calcium/sodium antiporter [Methylococcales bacterium]|nr:calcium/sodium antiporter [Methylococcales bacterium]